MKVNFAILFSLLTIDAAAFDRSILNFDYSKADSIAINYKKGTSNIASSIAYHLTVDLSTPHEKYRAIFRWITENIEYKRGRYGRDTERILKKGEAVCAGYSGLLKEMCNAVQIECKVINGYSKTSPRSDIPLKMKKTDHAWNVVKLYDKWYLSDVTWATSKYDTENRVFIKKFDENYFLSDPNYFILKHYPEDKEWILTDTSFTKRDFKNGPVFYSTHANYEFSELSIPKGLIRRNLKIEFFSNREIKIASLGFENSKDYIPLEVKSENGSVVIEHVFEKGDYGSFIVYLNGQAIWGFKKK